MEQDTSLGCKYMLYNHKVLPSRD